VTTWEMGGVWLCALCGGVRVTHLLLLQGYNNESLDVTLGGLRPLSSLTVLTY